MTDEQKNANVEANDVSMVAFIDLTETQVQIAKAYDLYDDRNEIAEKAFTQALKNAARSARNSAVLAKDAATRKGKKTIADALEVEIRQADVFLTSL